MSYFNFSDLTVVDSRLHDDDSDPLGLLAYQRHKRRRGVIGEETLIDEALTPQQRIHRKQIMRRLAPRLARARKIAMRKRGGNDVLMRRAKNLARKTIASKLLGGRNKADVSSGEKARVEKILATRKKGIDRLATKLLSVVRKKQNDRFAHKNAEKKPAEKKPEDTNK
jgi:hypothetical protein